jgi:hypothetical protein
VSVNAFVDPPGFATHIAAVLLISAKVAPPFVDLSTSSLAPVTKTVLASANFTEYRSSWSGAVPGPGVGTNL